MEGTAERFYVKRSIEDDFRKFVEGSCTAIAIVGDSGMGKSTLAAHLAEQYLSEGHVCLLAGSSEFPGTVEEVELSLIRKLIVDDPQPLQFWPTIDTACQKHSKNLFVFIDAINEFNSGFKAAHNPFHLMTEINHLVKRVHAKWRAIKIILTCRTETWRRGVNRARADFIEIQHAYYGGINGVSLGCFSDDESQQAYNKYRVERDIRTSYESLSNSARYLLREPIFLDVASKSYAGQEIPRELDTAEVFDRYVKRSELRGLTEYIQDFVEEMFAGGPPGVLQRVAIVRDRDLRKRNRSLFEALDLEGSLDSTGYRLKEERILQDQTAGGSVEFRFTHDRLAENLISKEFERYIDQATESRIDAAVAVLKANLPRAQAVNVAFEALRQTLLRLSDNCTADEYTSILRRTAALDARGLNLVISILSRLARIKDGLVVLTMLFRSLEAAADPESFPIVYAVYQILSDGEYRAWLQEHKTEELSHLSLLYGYLDWGLCHADDRIGEVTVQYLFFLWRGKDTLADGVEATRRILEKITGLSSSEIPSEQRRRITNLAGLMILLVAEMPHGDQFVLLMVRQALRSLRNSDFFRMLHQMNSVMGDYLIGLLNGLRNPVNFEELDAYYNERSNNLPEFTRVSEFLMGDCDPAELEPHLFRIVRNRNSFVLQMLTFALSVSWERAQTAEKRNLSLRMIDDLFTSGDPVGEYCASIALYHINYFGQHAKETMNLMEKMAAHILSKRKGIFELGKSQYNFNVIVTYGRSLHKVAAGLYEIELQFVMNDLNLARDTKDEHFYLYICENIGLLGILIPPDPVFRVITEILVDVGVIKQSGRQLAPFSEPFLVQARETALQSLANIRVVYRQEVDRYLFDKQELSGSTDLYDQVTCLKKPQFRLSTFHSWAIEQVMFRILTRYREKIGIDVVKAFLHGASQFSARDCIREMVLQVLSKLEKVA